VREGDLRGRGAIQTIAVFGGSKVEEVVEMEVARSNVPVGSV
jgi:hypothetical protein